LNCSELRATFIDAGHILGSASIVLEIDESAGTSKLCFPAISAMQRARSYALPRRRR
jgi:predicted metal-dependent RNase